MVLNMKTNQTAMARKTGARKDREDHAELPGKFLLGFRDLKVIFPPQGELPLTPYY